MSARSTNRQPAWVRVLPQSIRSKVEGRSSLQDVVHNVGWLMGDRIYRMGVGMLLGVWIARYLGPAQFGLLNYAISLTAIAGAFATLGLDTILVRELVSRKEESGKLIGTSFALRLLSGGFVILLSIIVPLALHDDGLSRALILILSAGFVAQSFDVFDYFFQSQVRSKYSVIARNAAFTLVGLAKIWLLLHNGELILFAVLVPVEFLIGGFGMLLAYRGISGPIRFSFSLTDAIQLLRDGWPLALSSIAILIYMRVDQLMIEKMMGSSANGVYAAAVRLVEVWYFIPMAVCSSVFPGIMRARATDPILYKQRLQRLYDFMAAISISFAILVTLTSGWIIPLLYGSAYATGAPVLTVYAWSGVATFLGVASSQFLTAENFTRISLYRTVIGMVLNVLLNLILIPLMGIVGSALATLVSYTAATFSIAIFSSGRNQGAMMLKALFPVHVFSTKENQL